MAEVLKIGTRKFRRNRARLVITLDIEVSDAHLRSMPPWKRDAMSALRDLVEQHRPSRPELLSAIRRQTRHFTIVEEKVEVGA